MTRARPSGRVLLVVAGGTVSHAAIARTAELAAGAPVTVVGVGTTESSRTAAFSAPPCHQTHPAAAPGLRVPSPRPAHPGVTSLSARDDTEPEQVRRTVALAMSALEAAGVMATGHVVVTGAPARAVARVARACGARAVILDQTGPMSGALPVRSGVSGTGGGAGGLMAELRRRMYGSGVVVLAETDRRGGWASA